MINVKNRLIAAALVALLGVGSIVPASAQSLLPGLNGRNDRVERPDRDRNDRGRGDRWDRRGDRDRVVRTYCQRNPRDRDCNSYRPGRWNDRDYDNFYRSRRGNLDGIASGLFGFTFGAIVGGALANQGQDRVVGVEGGSSNHVQACYDRFRSYDARTDTYLGFDGLRHRCNL